MLALLKEELANIGLEMHESKTKIITSFNETNIDFIDVNGLLLEVLLDNKAHKYLGRMLSCSDARGKGEVANRTKTARGAFQKHRRRLTNRHIPMQLRLKLFDSVVNPSALFSLATLPMTSSMISLIGVVQRKMVRSIIGWVRLP